MPQTSLGRKEEILMRSAQSRLGVVTSLGAARRGAGRCIEALPVSISALKVGGAAVAGIAGTALLRSLFSSRSKRKKSAAAKALPPAASAHNNLAGYLLTETVLTLLLPLCRRYFLGESASGSKVPSGEGGLGRLLKSGR